MRRAGLTDECCVIAIMDSNFGRGYFKGIEDGMAVFTSDIKWARAYKSAKRAVKRILVIAGAAHADEKLFDVVRAIG